MFNDNLVKHFSNIEKIVSDTCDYIEGNMICHRTIQNKTIERNKNKILNLQNLVQNKNNVCEIGVNAGHSLLIMLDKNPFANYQLFDLGEHPYTLKCIDYIKQQYSDTCINITYGDSKKTMLNYAKNNNNKFDMIHVDGGHQDDCVKSDYLSSLRMINETGYIVFDDYNLKNIKRFINKKLGKEIKEIQNTFYRKTNYHIIYQKI